MLAVGWMCEIRVCIRVMRHGRLGTINWADRLAILTLVACHVQTHGPSWARGRRCPAEHAARCRSCGVADGVVNQVGPSGTAHGSSELVKAHTPRRVRPSCRNSKSTRRHNNGPSRRARPEPARPAECRRPAHGRPAGRPPGPRGLSGRRAWAGAEYRPNQVSHPARSVSTTR